MGNKWLGFYENTESHHRQGTGRRMSNGAQAEEGIRVSKPTP